MLLVAAVAATSLVVCATAGAALQWQSPEALSSGAPNVNLGPDGAGLLFGFPTNTAYRLGVRPLGGPVGSPQDLPTLLGVDPGQVVGWFPDGSSLILEPSENAIAFRSAGAGGTVGTPQSLGTGNSPSAVATAASGQSLIGIAGSNSGYYPVGVAYRPAGASAQVDIAHAQYFGTLGGQSVAQTLIGLALDPQGGAVVVFRNGTTLVQTVRAPGSASFSNPVAIPAPGAYRIAMAADPSGNAVLAWMGGPPGGTGYGTQVTAAFRAPGGAFGAPHLIATEPSGEPTSVLPAVTKSGDGLVAWTGGFQGTSCTNMGQPSPGNDGSYGAFMSVGRNGAFGAPTALGAATWPSNSAVDGVASAGNTVAVAFHTETDGDGSKCAPPVTDSTASFVRTGSSGATGIDFAGNKATVSELPTGHNQYYSAGFIAMAANPLGCVLYEYHQYSSTGDALYLLPREDRSSKNGCGGGGGGGGGFKPIVPRNLIGLVPLDPINPAYVSTCPPGVQDECRFRVGVYAAFGAIPHPAPDASQASKRKIKKAALLGTGSTVILPGKKGKIKIKFTAAGRRALRAGRKLTVRVIVTVTYDHGHRASFVGKGKISAPRKHKHKR
jgi:hypothetical protein